MIKQFIFNTYKTLFYSNVTKLVYLKFCIHHLFLIMQKSNNPYLNLLNYFDFF